MNKISEYPIRRKYNFSGSRLFILAIILMFAGILQAQNVSLVVSPKDATANTTEVKWAIEQLQGALSAKGAKCQVRSDVKTVPAEDLCVVISDRTAKTANNILKKQKLTLPDVPEALGLLEGEAGGREVLLATGSDARGLVYAVLELTDRIQCGIPAQEALNVEKPVIEKPASQIRGIYRTFTNEKSDKLWYNDREFWTNYLTELATQRINRFSLALGMGYNSPRGVVDSYFFFPYPFLLDVPGYDVHAVGLSDEERDSNFEMLKFISDETAKRGMEFQLALWSHGYEFPEEVNYPIEGLNPDNHAAYCRDALEIILKSCPSITGTTFRVHSESGIPEGKVGFWEVLFEAHENTGRPIWIDMHGKNLTQDQLTWALNTGMPVSASPKYVGEHAGLPYHTADIRQREKGNYTRYKEPASGVYLDNRSYTRQGYGDFLPEDRQWDVWHRIWPGTNRLLLTGDPALFAGYGREASFCSSLGIDRMDPLSFRGRKGNDYSGGRCGYADLSLEPKWDYQKFLYTYRMWGRLLYNPNTDPEVWMRYLQNIFGDAARPMEEAMAYSTRVIYLMTTAHGAATNCTVYWPEIYNNMPVVHEKESSEFRDNPKPYVFGNVEPHDPQLFSKMNDYANDLLHGEEEGKYSPLVVAGWFEDMANKASRKLLMAEALIDDKNDVEFRRFYYDIKIQCGIARFFANKMRAAVLWHVYEGSGDPNALVEAIIFYTRGRDAWAKMAEEVKPIYAEDLTFGGGSYERGHWIDRIPAMDADIADMKATLAEAGKGAAGGSELRVQQAIHTVKSPAKPVRMDCVHTQVQEFMPGEPMQIKLEVTGEAKGVTLYYRHVNQALKWQSVPMDKNGTTCTAMIPPEYTNTRFPMSYYFVIDTDEGKSLYPGLDEDLSNMPYYVVRQSL